MKLYSTNNDISIEDYYTKYLTPLSWLVAKDKNISKCAIRELRQVAIVKYLSKAYPSNSQYPQRASISTFDRIFRKIMRNLASNDFRKREVRRRYISCSLGDIAPGLDNRSSEDLGIQLFEIDDFLNDLMEQLPNDNAKRVLTAMVSGRATSVKKLSQITKLSEKTCRNSRNMIKRLTIRCLEKGKKSYVFIWSILTPENLDPLSILVPM